MYSFHALTAALTLNLVAGLYDVSTGTIGSVEFVTVVGYDRNVEPSPPGCAGPPGSAEVCRPMYEKAEEKFLSYFVSDLLDCTDLESFVFPEDDCSFDKADLGLGVNVNQPAVGEPFCRTDDPEIVLPGGCTLKITGASIVNFAVRGRKAISGLNWIEDRTGVDFSVDFIGTEAECGEIIGFGFGTIDLNDQGGEFSLDIEKVDVMGSHEVIALTTPFEGGSVAYTALVEIESPFALDGVVVGNTKAGDGDIFGHDDFCILREENVKPCVDGIIDPGTGVCCCEECGTCGGCGCQELAGGAEECCIGTILELMLECERPFDCGCLIPPSAPFDPIDPSGIATDGFGECPSSAPTML